MDKEQLLRDMAVVGLAGVPLGLGISRSSLNPVVTQYGSTIAALSWLTLGICFWRLAIVKGNISGWNRPLYSRTNHPFMFWANVIVLTVVWFTFLVFLVAWALHDISNEA